MHPPSDMCKRLWRIHPQLRLAWAGRPPTYQGELNPGSFAVVQLYHISDVGRPGEEHTFRQLWDVDWIADEYGYLKTKRVSRGPIFSKDGLPRKDWSPLRVPIFVCTIDEAYHDAVTGEPLGADDVWSGKFLDSIRHWLMPIKDRVKKSHALRNQEIADEAEETAAEMGDFLLWEANKADQRSDASMARKFYRDELEAHEQKQQAADERLRNTYRVPD